MQRIFVFGSNLAGRHGAGAALEAVREHGAIYGVGFGIQGNSYAIPTKGFDMSVLPLSTIQAYVNEFKSYAKSHQDDWFYVTAIGTGLAGYKHEDIAPMFRGCPINCQLPMEWVGFYLQKGIEMITMK